MLNKYFFNFLENDREEDEVTEEDREVARYYLKNYLDGSVPSNVEEMKKLSALVTMIYQVSEKFDSHFSKYFIFF